MSINKMERKAVCEVCSCKSDCLNEVEELNICNGIPLSEALSILCKELILFICTTCCQLIEGEYIQKCLNIKIKDEALESCCFEEDVHVEVKLEETYNGILKSENLENTSSQCTLDSFPDLTNKANENMGRINESHDDSLITNCAVNNAIQCERQSKYSDGMVYATTELLNCNECNRNFKNKKSLNKHIKQIHEYTLIKCNECNKIFKNRIYFKAHMKRVHDTTVPVKCIECHKIFKNKCILKEHVKRIHVTTEPIKCNKCNKIFNNRIYLKIHLRRIHYISPMKCNECNKIFKNTTSFKLHLIRVHDEVTATCNICNKFYKNNYRLNVHKKRIHVRTKSSNIEDL